MNRGAWTCGSANIVIIIIFTLDLINIAISSGYGGGWPLAFFSGRCSSHSYTWGTSGRPRLLFPFFLSPYRMMNTFCCFSITSLERMINIPIIVGERVRPIHTQAHMHARRTWQHHHHQHHNRPILPVRQPSQAAAATAWVSRLLSPMRKRGRRNLLEECPGDFWINKLRGRLVVVENSLFFWHGYYLLTWAPTWSLLIFPSPTP